MLHLARGSQVPRQLVSSALQARFFRTHTQSRQVVPRSEVPTCMVVVLPSGGTRRWRIFVTTFPQVLQTSSPSYLLMASLDAARAQARVPQRIADAARRHASNVASFNV